MKKNKFIKVLRKHKKSCGALKYVKSKNWLTPWSYIEEIIYLTKTGLNSRSPKRGRVCRWFLIRCLCVDCPAKIAVKEDLFLNLLPKGKI